MVRRSFRLGVYGGSFNPVHIAHLRLALEARDELELDRVDLVPAARPPHKSAKGILPFAMRCELLASAVATLPGFYVNEIEKSRPGPSYTIDTLTEFQRTHPTWQIYYLMGAWDLLSLPTWYRGFELGSVANLVVIERGDKGIGDVANFFHMHRLEFGHIEQIDETCWQLENANRVHYLHMPRLDISATLVRERFLSKKSITYFVPESVEHGLERMRDTVTSIWGDFC